MGSTIDQTMSRVVRVMYERIGDELTVDDLARAALYSKFHFSRMFRQVTGVSPGRFLSTLRFQEAKRLLVHTSLSVAEISNRVGYSSLGTFSTRFKKFVGVTPTEYRRTGGRADLLQPSGDGHATVEGNLAAALGGEPGPTFVGLFPDPVPERQPVRSVVVPGPGPYRLTDVPAGTWYLLAHGVLRDAGPGSPPEGVQTGSVGRAGPVTVSVDGVAVVDLRLRPMRAVDLPVLPAPFVTRPGELARPTTPGRAAGPAVPRVPTSPRHLRTVPSRPLSAIWKTFDPARS